MRKFLYLAFIVFLASVFLHAQVMQVGIAGGTPAPSSGATWVLKNSQTNYNNNTPRTLPAFANALTNPSIIIVCAAQAFATAFDATPISDTAGNSYADSGAGNVVYNGSSFGMQCWYALNTHTTASNVISFANSGTHAMVIATAEFTGNKTSAPIDVSHVAANQDTGTGGGQNMSSGAGVSTADSELIIGFEGDTSLNPVKGATGTGFTTTASSSLEYLVQTTAGSIAATWSDATNSDKYGALMFAVKHP